MSNNLEYGTNTLQKQLEQLRKDWNTYIAGVKAKEKANYFIHFLDKNDILTLINFLHVSHFLSTQPKKWDTYIDTHSSDWLNSLSYF